MKRSTLALLFMLVLLVNACALTTPTVASQNGIEISNAVILTDADTMNNMGSNQAFAGYLNIKNRTSSDDQLESISCDFADVMLHETTMNGDVATMKDLSSIDLPVGETVELKVGGIHIMFMNLKRDIKVGDSVDLTMKFNKAGEITIPFAVRVR